jgi:hypothetical protein
MGTTLILDETGSMASMKEEPVQSVNAYVKIQKQSGFDVNIRIVRFAQVIKDMTRNVSDPELEIDDYDPDGMTALIDTVIYVILTATEAQHVLITTDGDDNSSTYNIGMNAPANSPSAHPNLKQNDVEAGVDGCNCYSLWR